MFWGLLQNVKMSKKNFGNSATSSWSRMKCIFFCALSVGILRFEELAQSLDVLMLVCKSKLPWSHIDHQLFIEASSVQRLHSLWNPWLHTFPTGISYLSSYVSTSEKFLTTMAHLLNTKPFLISLETFGHAKAPSEYNMVFFCILSNKQLCLTSSADSTGGLEAGSWRRGSIASSKHFEVERSNAPSRP